MKAVIFAAGKSTRTHPLTLTRPKPLLAVANRRILEHQLRALRGTVDGVIVVVGYKSEMIREAFGDRFEDIVIEYVEQTEQRGTGHALLQCANAVDGPFLAMNGDDLYDHGDLAALAAVDQGLLTKQVEDPRNFAIVEVDDAGRILRLEEKPQIIFSKQVSIGAYKLTPDVFGILENTQPTARGEIEMPSAIQTLTQNSKVLAVEAKGHWLPMVYPWDLLEANARLLESEEPHGIEGDVSPAAVLEGPVSVGAGTRVLPGAYIVGPVVIGADCTIGPNCFIRPATAIGTGCKVGQGVELKNSIVMDGASIPHLSYIGDSVVGERANLGCGTVTANFRHDGANHRSMVKGELIDTGRRKFGAIFGDDVHTGINTSIYPGRKLWPNTSTLPGQVVHVDIDK